MSHFAMTQDEVQVCDWTGEVPRAGDRMAAHGRGSMDYRGKWKVVDVLWMVRVTTTGPAEAQVTVEPACPSAEAWLERKRAEREQEA